MADHPVTVKAWSHSVPPFPSTLSQVDVHPPTDPRRLDPTSVLVEVDCAALNPVDVQVVNLSIFRLAALKGHHGLGKDFVGTVLAKGSAVTDDAYDVGNVIMGMSFNPLGDALSGTLSQVAVLDTTRTCAIRKPARFSSVEAASLPLVFLTAVTTLSRPYLALPTQWSDPTSTFSTATSSTTSGRGTIVVLGGSSAVGIYVVQYAAKHLGLDVVATCSARNLEFVRSLGARDVIDYTSESVPTRLTDLRPREGYLSIIDCVGGTELFASFDRLLRPRSTEYREGGNYVTIVGDKTSRASIGGSITNWFAPAQLVRSWKGYFGFGPRYRCIMLDSKKEYLDELDALVNAGKLDVVVDSVFAFDEVPQAFEKLNSGRARGKIVVRVKDT
ncbi:hypothetical protein JCM10212_004675 [Sporobolomyces blumeae]